MKRLFKLLSNSALGTMVALAGLSSQCLHAQQSPIQTTMSATTNYRPIAADRGASALWLSLKKLHTRASLMMITAHPDDEDGGMMTYESRGLGTRVALLTLNRGESGQNIMSNDYWDRLGLVRTEELLHADRYYGVDQYWTRVADFGFSKSRKESLEKWGYNRVLYDVVRAIRINRPLVLTSVFVGGVTDGHGHHQVAGEMTQEAFKAAGNPNMFPGQIKAGLLPWKPLKVYARVPTYAITPKGLFDYANGKYYPVRFYNYVTDKWSGKVPSTNVVIPEGSYSPFLGQSYLQFSRTGLGFQKSQNGGTGIPLPGAANVSYHLFGSDVPQSAGIQHNYFSGIDTSLIGIATLAHGNHPFLKNSLVKINALVDNAMQNYSATHLERIAPTLAQGLKETRALIREVQQSNLPRLDKYNVLHELKIKAVQFNDAVTESLGLSLRAVVASNQTLHGDLGFFRHAESPFTSVIPGQTFMVAVYLNNASNVPVRIQRVALHTPSREQWTVTPEKSTSSPLAGNKLRTSSFRVTVGQHAAYTQAYFHRPNIEQSYYNIADKKYLNYPLPPYPLQAWATVTYKGVSIQLAQDVQTVKRVTGRGDVYNPLPVVPAISVGITPHAGVISLNGTQRSLSVRIHSNVLDGAQGTIRLDLPAGWTSEPASAQFALAQNGQDQNINFIIHPGSLAEKSYTITAVAQYGGNSYRSGYVTVGYPGLRPYNYYRPAAYRLTGLKVHVAKNLNVGYIMGTGDSVPQSLTDLGIHVHMLDAQDIATGNLQQYNVIVLGIRTYAARPVLVTYNQRLLDYVKNGGVVIVQYNTREYDHDFGPYPYSLGKSPEKVVDESAQVKLLAPHNPLLNWPNKITETDFNNWIEERGHSFMKSWDPHYTALTETHDPGQAPQKGGLLYAKYGRGVYVYLAYALYRQLPEGVPGAYRLLANLISIPENRALTGK